MVVLNAPVLGAMTGETTVATGAILDISNVAIALGEDVALGGTLKGAGAARSGKATSRLVPRRSRWKARELGAPVRCATFPGRTRMRAR